MIINKKSFKEISDKHTSLYWPDGMLIAQNRFNAAREQFDMYLVEAGWADAEWMDELMKKLEEKWCYDRKTYL